MKRVASPPELVAELHGMVSFIRNYPGKPDREVVAAKLRNLADRVAAVKLPSEQEDGKPSYDDDFKAGFKAGEKAYKADDSISKVDADKAYRRVKGKHGTWWVDGFTAAIDSERGAYATKPVQIAKKMHLI